MGDFLLKYSPTKNIQVAGLLATVHVHSAGMLSSFVLNASTAEASLYPRRGLYELCLCVYTRVHSDRAGLSLSLVATSTSQRIHRQK